MIDINFIPDYKQMIKLEKNKTQILDLKNLLSPNKLKCYHKLLLPKMFRSEEAIQKELDLIEERMQKLTEAPVYSSGHAFVCFDSLISTYKILSSFEENTIKKISIKLKAISESMRKKEKRSFIQGDTATFGQFQDELRNDYDSTIETNKVNILVDQMVEPFDIIWLNVGGDRGLYICRRILCNLFIIVILFFLTSTTSFFSSNRFKEYFSKQNYNGFPYGHLLITYTPPCILLILNISIIYIIGILSCFETHYTHTNYHYAVFNKSFIYMLFNLFIIPAFTLTIDSIHQVFTSNLSIQDMISKAYLANSGYFFVALVFQCGSFSSLYYLVRVNELIANSFSPFIAFYQRHFINTGNQWHRKESSPFYFGYFYSFFLIFYTICLVFTSTVPLTSMAGLYMFVLRHIVDSISLLMVHGVEIDSNGRLLNLMLNRSCVPVFIYHCCMISLFLVKEKYTACILIIIVFIISIAYSYSAHSNYIFDFYSFHEKLALYDHLDHEVSENEINVWRNKYRHPLVIPIFIDNKVISNGIESQHYSASGEFQNSIKHLISS